MTDKYTIESPEIKNRFMISHDDGLRECILFNRHEVAALMNKAYKEGRENGICNFRIVAEERELDLKKRIDELHLEKQEIRKENIESYKKGYIESYTKGYRDGLNDR